MPTEFQGPAVDALILVAICGVLPCRQKPGSCRESTLKEFLYSMNKVTGERQHSWAAASDKLGRSAPAALGAGVYKPLSEGAYVTAHVTVIDGRAATTLPHPYFSAHILNKTK